MAKILLVEDDKGLADSVRDRLLLENHTVELIADGEEGFTRVRSTPYDLIILDWGLPHMSGVEILKRFRSLGGTTPVLLLTGHDTVDDKTQGLDSGADDYLPKPFNMRELSARVRALLRRPPLASQGNVYMAGAISVDCVRHTVSVDGQAVSLLPREFQLLEFFIRHPNQVFSQEALVKAVWPTDTEATLEALRTALKRMRKKVDPNGELLRTIHGVGYILETDK